MGGSTNTIRNHLMGTHHIEVDNVARSSSNPPSILSFLVAPRPKLTKTRGIELDKLIAAFIVLDCLPISIVEREGFCKGPFNYYVTL